MNTPKESGVFIGAYVPVDTAARLILASISSEGSDNKLSKSDIVRAALQQYFEQLKPSPTERMASHLLGQWHQIQVAGAKQKTTFVSYCDGARDELARLGVSPIIRDEIYERLMRHCPADKAK